jgi:ABC-type Fe3+/spermidine/putrescine transport system ATPase subunit
MPPNASSLEVIPLISNALEICGLEKTYGSFSVSLDLRVDEGETLVLAGPSGSGKTTALNLIAGLASPDSGRVLIGGVDVGGLPPWKRNISMVFQDLALFPHLDVGGNIAYGLFIRKVRRNERRRIIEEALETVRLPGYASRRVHTLSGGERQRVAIARALAVSPGALLLDEPFSSLDLPLRKELRAEFLEIRSRSKAPCVFVTHDREEAIMLGSRIALMKAGRVVEIGTGKELFLSPKTEFAARFLASGHVLHEGQDKMKLFIPHDAIHLGDSQAAAGRKTFSAVCQGSYYNGPNLVVKVLLPAAENSAEQFSMEIVASPRTNIPSPGSVVHLWVDEDLLRFVRADH